MVEPTVSDNQSGTFRTMGLFGRVGVEDAAVLPVPARRSSLDEFAAVEGAVVCGEGEEFAALTERVAGGILISCVGVGELEVGDGQAVGALGHSEDNWVVGRDRQICIERDNWLGGWIRGRNG